MNRTPAVLLGALVSGGASAVESFGAALADASWILDWRLRQETVDQQGFANDADALTSRIRAGLETAPLASTTLLAEAVWVADVNDDYNSTTNGNTAYPVVADPAGFAAINRFALTNTSLENVTWTVGRQRIVHDDARFVGNVGWRQNEQTYDAIRVQHAGARIETELTYAAQVNRIFGPDSAAGRWSGDIVMARASRTVGTGRLTAFHYLLEIDEAPALSTRTTGLRYAGTTPLGDVELNYEIAAASQSDAGANPASFSEPWYFAEAGLALAKLSAALGYERLGGDGTSRVTTPLATLHAFQGWADRFLATPESGLADRFVRFGYALGPAGPFARLDLSAVYHAFDADAGGAGLGNETDVVLVARTDRLTLTLKVASYAAGASGADTDKAWLALDYSW